MSQRQPYPYTLQLLKTSMNNLLSHPSEAQKYYVCKIVGRGHDQSD